MTLFLLRFTLLFLFLRWLSLQKLCPKTVDSWRFSLFLTQLTVSKQAVPEHVPVFLAESDGGSMPPPILRKVQQALAVAHVRLLGGAKIDNSIGA